MLGRLFISCRSSSVAPLNTNETVASFLGAHFRFAANRQDPSEISDSGIGCNALTYCIA